MKQQELLRKPRQFSLVHSRGTSWVASSMVVKAMPNGLEVSRCGFSVSRRVGGAVVRNRVRRRLREIMRSTTVQPGWDIVLVARPPAADATYTTLKTAVVALLRRGRLGSVE